MPLEQLTKAFVSFFKGKRDRRFPYGLRVGEVSSDWSIISLIMTLRSGTRYCCGEPGCHIGLLFSEDYQCLREHLTAAGFPVSKPLTLRVRWVVEGGVFLDVNRGSGGHGRMEHACTCNCTFSEMDAYQLDYFR